MSEHVCGLSGYNPEIDPPCEGCWLQRHRHYFKPCPYNQIDVYRVLEIFDISDPCLQHAAKKLLVAGVRGHKDIRRDIQDAIDSLERWKQMRAEESGE